MTGKEINENGMIVGAERYDPQCQKQRERRCSWCGWWMPEEDLTIFANGERVCNDCLRDYCISRGGEEAVAPYIARHEREFWLDWMFGSAGPAEQLRVVKAGYLAECAHPMQREYIRQQETEFCQNDTYFMDYVKERLR